LVGQNNCGKTTILEAIFFLVGATNPQLPAVTNSLRGLPFLSKELWLTFFHNFEVKLPIEIEAELCESDEKQKLLINPFKRKKLPTTPVASDIISLEPKALEFKTQLELDGLELKYYSSKQTIPSTSTIFLDGIQLAIEGAKESSTKGIFLTGSQGYDWRGRFGMIQRKKQVEQVVSFLQEIDPTIQKLSLNEIGVVEADIGLPTLVPVNLMGGGIAKVLSVILASFEAQNGILLIDEIENGLHYSAQETIWKAVFSLAQKLNVQVFATTHSRECIAAFKNSAHPNLFASEPKLYRIERKGEPFRTVEYTSGILAESLDSNWEVR
jgi:AAA15 family ATPase/GTPase